MKLTNPDNYDSRYSEKKGFLRWPADWLLRFHNMYLRDKLTSESRVLDFGLGSGNNSLPFLKAGLEVYGVEVAQHSRELISENLDYHGLAHSFLDRVSIQDPPLTQLPYDDNFFDLVISNQVHYYSTSEDELHGVNQELSRVLKPGGTIFVTMMGPSNDYITRWTAQVSDAGVHHVRIDDPNDRLNGVAQDILLVRDESHLLDLFREFKPLTTGHFDQGMFDMKSNFHFIFAGSK